MTSVSAFSSVSSSLLSTRTPIRTDPHPLLPSLNTLLASLLIPITLSSLSLATPSLLLSLLESLLETRFEVAKDVRSSWERRHRTEVTEFLVAAVGVVLDHRGEVMERVEIKDVVRGREEEIAKLVEGLLRIASGMGLVRPASAASTRSPSPSSTATPTPTSPSLFRASFTTPIPVPRPPPASRSPRPSSSLSISSRVSLRSLVEATSPPQPSPPATPRSTLRLMGLAGRLPSQLADAPLAPLRYEKPRREGKVVRPIPKRSIGSGIGWREGKETPPTSTSEEETPILRTWREAKRKGKAKERTKEEVCDCAVLMVGELAHDGVCTCAEEHELDNSEFSPPDPPRLQSSPPPKSRPPHRAQPSAPSTSSTSHRRTLSHPPPPPLAKPHRRTHSTQTHSHSTPFRPPPIRLIQDSLPLMSDSEIASFERRRARHPPAAAGVRPAIVPGLEPPEGWEWIAVGVGATFPGEAGARLGGEEGGRETEEEGGESPYTRLLLEQRARLRERLRELTLGGEERGVLESATEEEGEREVVRARVGRVRVERVGW